MSTRKRNCRWLQPHKGEKCCAVPGEGKFIVFAIYRMQFLFNFNFRNNFFKIIIFLLNAIFFGSCTANEK